MTMDIEKYKPKPMEVKISKRHSTKLADSLLLTIAPSIAPIKATAKYANALLNAGLISFQINGF
jgi:hypothetical protein